MDRRFELLFEPVQIGPVTAPNRFYQVPHCTGMGYVLPQTLASMREVKAAGGWGVVNTEYCSIHPTSDDMPYAFASLWDDGDIENMSAMTEAVHKHGALAGVELWHGGGSSANYHSRMSSLSVQSVPAARAPWQSRKMDINDIKQFRRWHLDAAIRARKADFDIVYAYATHGYLLDQFLNDELNRSNSPYGSASGGAKLVVELLEDMRQAIGDRCAIALRIDVSEPKNRERRSELLSSIAHLVDLFDITVPDYSHEMGVSRFVKEGSLESEISHVRVATGKPVVSVGRFTSPETMLSQVKRGILDLVGAARPSIADPYLPSKIKEGRYDDIRECIGCNICYGHNSLGVPIRCTQNPTMGEEWRRGWHPEKLSAAELRGPALVVGAGPAGLELALSLARRGVEVMLAEGTRHLGGRVNMESKLPGLSEWSRVRDWRVTQLEKLSNVQIFRESIMSADSVIELGVEHVFVATGSRWRIDGRGRFFPHGVPSYANPMTMSVEKAAKFEAGSARVVIFDDDNYYLGSAIAEKLARLGYKTVLVTSQGRVSDWSGYTAEQDAVQRNLIRLGVELRTSSSVTALGSDYVELSCVYSGKQEQLGCDIFVPVTSREPNDILWVELKERGLQTLCRVGDCSAPGIIAQAVYDGHRAAREFGQANSPLPRRERVIVKR